MQEKEYAKALFELALDNSSMLEYFNAFYSLLDVDFLDFLKAPNIKKENKKEVIKKSLKGFDNTFINFLYVIIDNNRINDIKVIYDEYYRLVKESMGYILVDCYLSNELDDVQTSKLTTSLELKLGKKVELKKHINPNLIGGMQIIYDGKSIDQTVLNEFIKIKSLL